MTEDAGVPIEFKGRHDHISPRMKEHATGKLARLARFEQALQRIEVVADHAHENPEMELIVHRKRGQPLVAKDRGASFSATIDLLVDKMEVQLRKEKEKRSDHKVPDAKEERARAADVKRPGKPDDDTYEDALRKRLDD